MKESGERLGSDLNFQNKDLHTILNASSPQSVSRLIPLLFASLLVLMSKILSH